MAFLRSISRNARWSGVFRLCSESNPLKTLPRSGILIGNNNASAGAMTNRELFNPRASFGFTRGFSRGAEEAGDASDEGDAAGGEREIYISHALKPEDVEPFNRLEKLFMNDKKRLMPEQLISEWEENGGHKLNEAMVVKLFRVLVTTRHDQQADRLIHWLLTDKPLGLTETIYLLALSRAQRLRKWPLAMRIYSRISEDERTPAIRTAMVIIYTKMENVENAEQVLSSFTPKTPQAFNALIKLHLKLEQFERAGEVYTRLIKAGLKPSRTTLMLVLKHRDQLGLKINEAEAESILNEGIDEMATNRIELYSALESMVAFAYMGNLKAVHSLWNRIEKVSSLPVNAWVFGVRAFGYLGDVEKVQELARRFTEKKNREYRREFYPALAEAYIRNKMFDEVDEIVKRLDDMVRDESRIKLGCKIYDAIIQTLLERNEPEMAIRRMRELQENQKTEIKFGPAFETVRKLMPIYTKRKDVEGAEALVALTNRVDPSVHNELLRTYIAAGKNPGDKFLERMTKAKPNEETRRLLKEALKLPQSA